MPEGDTLQRIPRQISLQICGQSVEGQGRRFRDSTLGDRLWVYRRRGLPCFECRTPIQMRRQGETARSSYCCPRRQNLGP